MNIILKFKYYGTPCNVKKIETGDILRVPQADLDCRYPKYNNFSNRSDFADMLEIPQVLKRIENLWYISLNARISHDPVT